MTCIQTWQLANVFVFMPLMHHAIIYLQGDAQPASSYQFEISRAITSPQDKHTQICILAVQINIWLELLQGQCPNTWIMDIKAFLLTVCQRYASYVFFLRFSWASSCQSIRKTSYHETTSTMMTQVYHRSQFCQNRIQKVM